ncbi:UDP-N-acetylmuramate dehydrogenase [Pelagibacteraceae bacterium]|nr:UDP-N-acetylmuramate dehydrogenase [Pelagibacteraceae bacterium]
MKNSLKDSNNDNIYLNEKLSKYSWFNLGGPAEIFFRPKDEIQLSQFLKRNKYLVNIIGAGSNTLFRDGGVKGATIKLSSKFSYTNLLENNTIEVGASTLDKTVSDFATSNSIAGFEFLSCIPGSIGGGIIMNSGCYGDDISKILVSIKAMDLNGNIKTINKNEIEFRYRGCNLASDLIILSAQLKGQANQIDKIKKKQLDLIQRKKISQPSRVKTCGSTFKNIKDKKAWELIKESNCDKIKVGKAKISEEHCNFIINDGGASSYEIEELIKKVKSKVLEKTGVKLDLEIKIIGENL